MQRRRGAFSSNSRRRRIRARPNLGGQARTEARRKPQRRAIAPRLDAPSRFERRELDLDQQIDAAVARRCRVHDHAARLAWIVGMEEFGAGPRGIGFARHVGERRCGA